MNKFSVTMNMFVFTVKFIAGVKLTMYVINGETMPIKWRLPVVMADREMDYKQLASATKLHPGTVSKLKNNLPDRLEMETLMKLCKALDCQPGDLLVYVPGQGEDL